jgi:hypothetical protein
MIDRDELTLTSAFDFARDMIKALTLVNGGAVLSLLTFYGSLLDGNSPVAAAFSARNLAFFGLLCFACGVLFSVLSGCFAYLTQLKWGIAHLDKKSEYAAQILAGKFHTSSMVLALFSVVSFMAGILLSAGALFWNTAR